MAIDIPVTSNIAPVGPGGRFFTDYNALTQANLVNQKAALENQYYAPIAQANAMSKIAYANLAPADAIAKILGGPGAAMMTPDQYKILTQTFQQSLPTTGVNTAAMFNANQTPRSNGLLGMLMNKLSSNQNQSGQQSGAPNTNALNTIPLSAPDQIDQGSANALSGGSPTYNRASSGFPAGMQGANNPSAISAAGVAGLKSQTEAEGKAIADQWKERQDDINQQVSGAQEMERQLEKLDDARGRLSKFEKGPFIGKLPAVSSAAQDADIAISNLVAARLKAWQSNRITNMDIGFGQMLKPGRYMTDSSFKNETNYEKGMAERMQEYPAFSQRAQEAGLTPSKADAVWARYANEKPFFDPKSKNVLDENLQTWENYLSPDSLKETFSPQFKKQMDQYRKNMAGGDPAADKKIQNQFNSSQSVPSEGAKILARSLELPTFNSAKEFKDWYDAQPRITQDAVKIKLGKK